MQTFLAGDNWNETLDAYTFRHNGHYVTVHEIKKDEGKKEDNRYLVIFEYGAPDGSRKFPKSYVTFEQGVELTDFTKEKDITGVRFRELSRQLMLHRCFGRRIG